MEVTAIPIPPTNQPVGTGGFLDPDRIAENFGITEGMSIADFGSGAGYFTLLMAQRTGSDGKVYAIDIIKDKLESLISRARSLGLYNIEAIRTDLEVSGSSSLSEESQDVVLLANILFQSNKHQKILGEGARILKKGGSLIIIDWQKGTGGFGPPNSLRIDQADMQAMIEKMGLKLETKFDAGHFHFGLIFKK